MPARITAYVRQPHTIAGYVSGGFAWMVSLQPDRTGRERDADARTHLHLHLHLHVIPRSRESAQLSCPYMYPIAPIQRSLVLTSRCVELRDSE
jgi:hypothetical protein